MSESHILDLKKRLMFVKGEDFYFLTYNTLVLLKELDCTDVKAPFKDHRKLAFLVDFVADPKLIEIVERRITKTWPLTPRERHELVRAYSDGAARVHLITRLISALQSHGILRIVRDQDSLSANLYLDVTKIPTAFLSSELYEQERQDVAALVQAIPRLRTTTLASVLKHLFAENGVQVWHA